MDSVIPAWSGERQVRVTQTSLSGLWAADEIRLPPTAVSILVIIDCGKWFRLAQ